MAVGPCIVAGEVPARKKHPIQLLEFLILVNCWPMVVQYFNLLIFFDFKIGILCNIKKMIHGCLKRLTNQDYFRVNPVP